MSKAAVNFKTKSPKIHVREARFGRYKFKVTVEEAGLQLKASAHHVKEGVGVSLILSTKDAMKYTQGSVWKYVYQVLLEELVHYQVLDVLAMGMSLKHGKI